MKDTVEAELRRLEEANIISPVKHSEWAAPIVPVLKKDKSLRICGDYKVSANQAVETETYPLPRLEELLATLSGGKIFSKIDLAAAYQQVLLDDDSKKYTTINTHRGLFVYNRLPFGISSAPSIFQRIMENLMKDLPVVVFLDDLLVTGRTEKEHLDNLQKVLQHLQENGLRVKRPKCGQNTDRVSGHVLDEHGIHPSKDKVRVIQHTMPDGKERPVAYASRTLNPAEKNYSQIEKEALGLIYGVKKFHQYLWGRHFTLVTDHRPLVTLFGEHKSLPTLAAARIQRWAIILSAYNYHIVYRKSEEHSNADGLSRCPLPETSDAGTAGSTAQVHSLLDEHMQAAPLNATQVAQATRTDSELSRVYKYVMEGWPNQEVRERDSDTVHRRHGDQLRARAMAEQETEHDEQEIGHDAHETEPQAELDVSKDSSHDIVDSTRQTPKLPEPEPVALRRSTREIKPPERYRQ
ncbi:hypothetical protein SKAU_G00105660 [Synaphobranchus kaupii]|uniref:ribonuclease H n=1 Tax=Synaphobranchus kaupii TaxID=118154 RepID=A0A9Q1FZ89_SYNKA|nr:hypothetical protein SKAU_G00105660 [Synaphobranchus kaupii]